MRSKILAISVVSVLAAGTLVVIGGPGRTPEQGTVIPAEDLVEVRFPNPQAEARVYQGPIKDVRPVWSLLILSVGKGSQARDIRFDMSEARIVGPDGNEWKGQDLRVGDRVRVELTADRKLVQQISVLPARASDIE
jgi:hypothetical protein